MTTIIIHGLPMERVPISVPKVLVPASKRDRRYLRHRQNAQTQKVLVTLRNHLLRRWQRRSPKRGRLFLKGQQMTFH